MIVYEIVSVGRIYFPDENGFRIKLCFNNSELQFTPQQIKEIIPIMKQLFLR
jgi:hypothetical protein